MRLFLATLSRHLNKHDGVVANSSDYSLILRLSSQTHSRFRPRPIPSDALILRHSVSVSPPWPSAPSWVQHLWQKLAFGKNKVSLLWCTQRTSSASSPQKSTPARQNMHNFLKNEFRNNLLIMEGHLDVFVKVSYFVLTFTSKVGLRNVLGTISKISVNPQKSGSLSIVAWRW